MPGFVPSTGCLSQTFSKTSPFYLQQQQTDQKQSPSKYAAQEHLYHSFSVADDAKQKAMQLGDKSKDKAEQLSDKAVHEFEKASSTAQAKAGRIELYSPKYYAACVTGGLLACVSKPSKGGEP